MIIDRTLSGVWSAYTTQWSEFHLLFKHYHKGISWCWDMFSRVVGYFPYQHNNGHWKHLPTITIKSQWLWQCPFTIRIAGKLVTTNIITLLVLDYRQVERLLRDLVCTSTASCIAPRSSSRWLMYWRWVERENAESGIYCVSRVHFCRSIWTGMNSHTNGRNDGETHTFLPWQQTYHCLLILIPSRCH